jgi:hypothetical protein
MTKEERLKLRNILKKHYESKENGYNRITSSFSDDYDFKFFHIDNETHIYLDNECKKEILITKSFNNKEEPIRVLDNNLIDVLIYLGIPFTIYDIQDYIMNNYTNFEIIKGKYNRELSIKFKPIENDYRTIELYTDEYEINEFKEEIFKIELYYEYEKLNNEIFYLKLNKLDLFKFLKSIKNAK